VSLKSKNKISQDELRQKVDGFSLEDKAKEAEHNSYITTDQGVYYPPDDYVDKK
jgi:hypothetical protein